METNLPITVLNWLIALIPIVVLIVLLVVLRWTAAQAGAVGFAVGVVLAWLVFQSPFDTLATAIGKGIWDALFILAVVWPALLLYEVTDRADAFNVLRVKLQSYTKSRLLLTLAFGWVFASFLQGIAGFGVPIAIVAPLLVGIGMKPLYAVIVPLIGHAWANMFGTLAVGWLATLQVVDLENPTQTAVATAALLWIPNLMSGLWIAYLYSGFDSLKRALPAVGLITLIHGAGQLGLAFINPVISNFIAATVAVGALILLQRMPRFKEADPMESRMFEEGGAAEEEEQEPKYSVHLAMLPYYVLIAVSLFVLVIPPVNQFLEQFQIGFAFPEVTTGYGVVNPAEEPYGAIEVFTHPGLLLLFSSIVAYLVFKAKGLYENGRSKGIGSGVAGNALAPSIAVLGFLTLSTLMDHSGMTRVLALGIAEVSPPLVFAFASNFIGVLGAFMTSSNTASNILFAPLQNETAQATALTQSTVIAAQSTGGAIGNAIAPANVVLGTGTAKIPGQEGAVLRSTLPYAAVTAVLTGIGAVVLQFVLSGGS